MPCTTLLVGRKASNDGSTMIARTDDGHFDVKKMVVVSPKQQPKKYKCVLSHLQIELPENPMRYTACPSVDRKNGIWAATGINEANVGMTATETITSNARVLSADPLVQYQKAKNRREKDSPGGIGEEDLVVLVLPYIHSAREGVLRLASLLEQYGTYESNGIAFNDEREIWWMETIGGHHWIARRVPDDRCVLMPNQFGMDGFDPEDAFGDGKEYLCSKDLREFITENHLDLNQEGKWDGENAEYSPESDNIPWSLVPERKVTVEDVKYLLSSHYQGTPYNPYSNRDTGKRGMYRSIGINRTGVTSVCQIRTGIPEAIKAIEWICFGSTTFDALLPVYPNTDKLPDYLSKVTLDVSTENFYWSSRLIGALADHNYSTSIQDIERYQDAVAVRGRQIVREYDAKMTQSENYSLISEANEKLCTMAKEETAKALNKVLLDATTHMKNGFTLADN